MVGFVDRAAGKARDDAGHARVHNAAALLHDGRVRGIYHKGLLPNYGVFDEDRYFVAGTDRGALWEINGVFAGVSVCEDIWVEDGPPADQAAGRGRHPAERQRIALPHRQGRRAGGRCCRSGPGRPACRWCT